MGEYMLVMLVNPSDGRKFYHRIFVDLMANEVMGIDRVLSHEREEAQKLRVHPKELFTVNVVKLQ